MLARERVSPNSDLGTPAGEPPVLRRSLSLTEATLGGVGIICGAGVYALIGAVAAEAGNGLWLSFVLAALAAGAIGLCYAELASMFPASGADYEYTLQAFGAGAAFVIGWLMVIGSIIGAATVALAFGGYLSALAGVDATTAAVVALAVATLIAFYGIEETVRVVIVGTVVEVCGLILVIAMGIPYLPDANLDLTHGGAGVISGAALVMFAFIGFSQIATLAEEAEDAPRVVPRAMLLSISVAAVLYVLVAVSALAVLGWQELAASEAPLADVASAAIGGRASDLIAIIALFATANTMLLMLIAGSRLIYGMASRRALPRFLAWIHPGRRTPARAISLVLLLATAFALTGRLSFVAGATNFAIYAGFGAACLSVLALRRSRPQLDRPFRVPLNPAGVPVIAVLGLLLTVALAVSLERDVLALGAVLCASGVLAMHVLALWRPAHE